MLYYDIITDKCYLDGVEIPIETAEAMYAEIQRLVLC